MLRAVRYRLEALLAFALYRFFALLPRRIASALGGAIARSIGCFLPVSGKATANIHRVLPECTAAEQRQIVRQVWDNLGRVAAELPHVHTLRIAWAEDADAATADVVIEGREHIRPWQGKPVIFAGGHFGNWEILGKVAVFMEMPIVRLYRAANNPYVDKLIYDARNKVPGGLVAKGSKGARELLKAQKEGKSLGFLADQRLSDGVLVPFMGIPAKTARAPAEFARRWQYPLIPVVCYRLPGSRFRVVVEPPIPCISGSSDEDLLTAMNQTFERWIRQQPGNWLWLHRRWPHQQQG